MFGIVCTKHKVNLIPSEDGVHAGLFAMVYDDTDEEVVEEGGTYYRAYAFDLSYFDCPKDDEDASCAEFHAVINLDTGEPFPSDQFEDNIHIDWARTEIY